MEKIEANKVFSKIDFQKDIDYNIYPRSIYECPVCRNKLSFNMQNFKKYSLNTQSIFSIEEQKKIEKYIHTGKQKKPNSFIDFYCPKCNVPTRIYFTAWAGGRFTGGYHLEFIIINA
ncbi:MAG: hypothetical protein LBR79_05435 [Oscillospiraceae bacterium]|jgi:DNA-directed RNA polymerase subunit M/transcription elongation factor TFIIS|nr:hypothetical protein [Oscillospiraceae bacterium]